MKLRIFLAASAALALAGCHKAAGPAPGASESAAPAASAAATPAAATPAAAAGGALTEAYVLGKWADAADGCKRSQEFLAGGKVNGMFDSWKIDGDGLTVGMMGESQHLKVTVVDHDHMDTQIAGASVHKLMRC